MAESVNIGGTTYGPYSLARLAQCASPDSPTSPGAEMLLSLASATADQIDTYREEKTPEDRWDYSGELAEIADDGPSVYTAEMWAQFVDLAAYNEDPTELGADASDMEKAARVCLYLIAERLVRALVAEHGPYDEDDEDDDEA